MIETNVALHVSCPARTVLVQGFDRRSLCSRKGLNTLQRSQCVRMQCICQASCSNVAMAAAAAEPTTKTLKIGTRGSPLAMAQAYLTKQLLQVGNMHKTVAYARPHDDQQLHLLVLSVSNSAPFFIFMSSTLYLVSILKPQQKHAKV